MAWNIQGLPSDLLTDDIEGVRRLAVDQQQTSFEKNFQFGFFDRFVNIAATDQLVYKVTVGRDSILFNRANELWTGGTVGQVLTKNSATDYDYSWITPASAGTITSLSASLSADVALTTTSTWYDGPSLSLPAGTWVVMGQITHVRSATTAENVFARLGDGTTSYSSTQFYHASVTVTGVVLPMIAKITLAATTTIKLQATSSAGASTSTMKAALTANGVGNNATNIIAVRLS